MVAAIAEHDKSQNDPRKVIVAVHGIGDQGSYATIQSVLFQFCRFFGAPAAVPLGSFYPDLGFARLEHPPFPPGLSKLGFAEVYWANIPRKNASEYTLEDSNKWAKTIVERVRQRKELAAAKIKNGGPNNGVGAAKGSTDALRGDPDRTAAPDKTVAAAKTKSTVDSSEQDFPILEDVLTEMLQTLHVLDRLCFLGERAGVFKFDLNKVLVDYLGDVQIVTEFKMLRKQIIETFIAVMEKVHKVDKDADIYIVAHSEGSVITILGLLDSLCCNKTPPWLNKVKGLMTIGSPIDKHLILWPELFEKYAKEPLIPEHPIQWQNYFDIGDPIGFNLDYFRKIFKKYWGESVYSKVFDFTAECDHGFSRYPLPGKAHNDYWTDHEVFGHFLTKVVFPKPGVRSRDKGSVNDENPTKPGVRSRDKGSVNDENPTKPDVPACDKGSVNYENPPKSKFLTPIAATLLTYSVVGALLYLATFVLFKSVHVYIFGPDTQTSGEVVKDSFPIALLLAGLTVGVRIPRLTRQWQWRVFAVIAFLVSAIGYYYIRGGHWRLIVAAGALFLWMHTVYFFRFRFLPSDTRTLVITGMIAAAASIGTYVIQYGGSDHGPLWPVLLAAGAFFYLWWLAGLLFDLSFIWHRYIRNSRVMTCLRDIQPGVSIGGTT